MSQDWSWSDAAWRDRVGGASDEALREALRRAVHLRDSLAEGEASTTEAVMLVDVLNYACSLLEIRHDIQEL